MPWFAWHLEAIIYKYWYKKNCTNSGHFGSFRERGREPSREVREAASHFVEERMSPETTPPRPLRC